MNDFTQKESFVLHMHEISKNLKYLQKTLTPPQTDREKSVKKHIDSILNMFKEYQERIEKTVGLNYQQVHGKIKKLKQSGEKPPVLPKDKFALNFEE